jgi:putative ABC transport system substrate-binding protein
MWLSTLGLLITFGIGLLWALLVATAQQPGKVYRIGVLSLASPPSEPDWQQRSPNWQSFWQGMRELGWMEGQNIVSAYRWADRQLERLPALATELIQLKVDLIVTPATLETRAAKQATTTIPIVMVHPVDPVGNRLVASLAHPGANVTGLTTIASELHAKRLELLKETVPGSLRIAVLACKGLSVSAYGWEGMQDTARALDVQLHLLEAREPDDYAGAFAAARSAGAEAMVVLECYFNAFNLQRIVDLAAKYRLPAIYGWRGAGQAGGLLSYGQNYPDLYRHAATYVDKILKGAKPGDLPVEQPTKFYLVINLKTAQALGLTIPPTLLMLADEVIR